MPHVCTQRRIKNEHIPQYIPTQNNRKPKNVVIEHKGILINGYKIRQETQKILTKCKDSDMITVAKKKEEFEMGVLGHLQSDKVFYYFEEITKIPHGSGNEAALAQYIADFAKERNLEHSIDKAGNVVVKKPAFAGYENAPGVIFQGHIDMVCEKLGSVEHDFTKDPLQLEIDGDFIRAKGTTLGADNGIAVAYMLAMLDHKDLPSPAIEAIFTTEEETGMGGAVAFDASGLKGKYFINMDSEEEGKFLISCCGGRRVRVNLPIEREAKQADAVTYTLQIKGLKGGHSGSDIHLQRANSNKLMGRLLQELCDKDVAYAISEINGGRMDNAICRETAAVLVLTEAEAQKAAKVIADMETLLKKEYRHTDADMIITWEKATDAGNEVFTEKVKQNCIAVLLLIPYGVQTMSLDIDGLVESSSNIGVVETAEKAVYFDSAVRSAVASRKEVICNQIKAIADLAGATVESSNDYPGWVYDANSQLLKFLEDAYRATSGKEPELMALHAGVECGMFAEKMPGLDMVSLGPDMYDVHTPEERLSISSTERTWEFLKEALKRMK